MKATIPLGRYAGIPIGAHWSVLFTVALLVDLLAASILPAAVPGLPVSAYWITAVAVTALFVASLLAHELAHATLARRIGVKVKSITLWMLGGAAVFEDEPPNPRADALVAGIGPAASAGLAAVFLAAAVGMSPAWLSGLPAAGLIWLAVVNLLLAGFNLLPAAPLDGGRLLRAWLWKRSGDRDCAACTTRGWSPSRVPVRYDVEEFIQRYAHEAGISPDDVAIAVAAVSGALRDLFSAGQLDHALAQLPAPLRAYLTAPGSHTLPSGTGRSDTGTRLLALEHAVELLTQAVTELARGLESNPLEEPDEERGARAARAVHQLLLTRSPTT